MYNKQSLSFIGAYTLFFYKGNHGKVTKTQKETFLAREQRGQSLPGRQLQGCSEHQDSIAKANAKQKSTAIEWSAKLLPIYLSPIIFFKDIS